MVVMWPLVCSLFHRFCWFYWSFNRWSFSSWFLGSCSNLFFQGFFFFPQIWLCLLSLSIFFFMLCNSFSSPLILGQNSTCSYIIIFKLLVLYSLGGKSICARFGEISPVDTTWFWKAPQCLEKSFEDTGNSLPWKTLFFLIWLF